MPTLEFTRNDYPTVGIELELQLVHAETYALTSAIDRVLESLPPELSDQIKPELMQCYLEINTGVCRTISDARVDLRAKLDSLERALEPLELKLFWAATHPFSSWRDQDITVNDRYYRLVELMQDVARRLVTFGLHVHVGVDSGDKAIMVCERMQRHLPLLLAMSSNSPFWEGRNTGLHSNRSKIMEGLPTAGLPHLLRNWSEYTWLINHLVDTGFINSIREIWWDIRPHHNFGTVEVRVCDMPANLEQALSIAALVQCMVQLISEEIDEGAYQREYHPMMIQQNKWRATRFGPDAPLVESHDYRQQTVQQTLDGLIELLVPMSRRLECENELVAAATLPENTGSRQQLAIFEETGSGQEVVRRMIAENAWR